MLTITATGKWIIVFSVLFLFVCILLISEPIPQNLAYHLLTDNRSKFGIPNFADVISNLPFAIIGLAGVFMCLNAKIKTSLSWLTFFTGLIFVALGSSYYHLNPNNQTLVWDRLPMMISFMGLFIALLSENIPGINEKPILPVAVLTGFSSVIYWHYTNDLRFYAFMQLAPLAAIPLILYLYKGQYSHRRFLMYGLVFYMLAKVFEMADQYIFELTGQLFSGHTIKHLLAATATYCLYLMLKKRHIVST